MENPTVILNGVEYSLTSPKDLLTLIELFTDGVWNTSDTASFNEDEIRALQEIREYINQNRV